MDLNLSEEHKTVRNAAKSFAQSHLLEGVIERDRHMEHPAEEVKEMGVMGFMGIMTSPAYGGSGMDTLSYVLVLEEISKIDASAAVIMSAHNSLVLWAIESYGTAAQKENYLIPMASGQSLGCFCLSEPEAGSDATMQRTTAEDKGAYYLLNGVKNWITNGGHATYQLVIAQTNPDKKHKGINAFIVEKKWDGVTIGPKEDKLGIRSSDTHSISYTDVKVPKENRIGPDGFGFKLAMQILEGGRIGIAAQALGIAAGAYERSVTYAKERNAFGKPIAEHQAIAFKLAEMATDIEAARMLVYRAAVLKDQGVPFGYASAMAKLKASEIAMKHTVEAVQIHGGNGYVKEYHVERLMRDAKITQIYEGTSEIHKIILSRNILNGELYLPI
ncbi:MAG: acyl-CoA dehydrogenase family protein [Flavobacteriaceae bacterium]